MHTDPAHGGMRSHKPRHVAEKVEGMIGVVLMVAMILLALGLVWGLMQTGNSTPSWMS